MITLISESNALEIVQERLLLQAITEGFVSDKKVAIDATHVESRNRALFKTEEVKEEREQWLLDQVEKEANLPIFEKTIVDQLDVELEVLRSSVPIEPR